MNINPNRTRVTETGVKQIVPEGQEPAEYASDLDPKFTWGDNKQPRQVTPCSFCKCGGIIDPKTNKCRKCGSEAK